MFTAYSKMPDKRYHCEGALKQSQSLGMFQKNPGSGPHVCEPWMFLNNCLNNQLRNALEDGNGDIDVSIPYISFIPADAKLFIFVMG